MLIGQNTVLANDGGSTALPGWSKITKRKQELLDKHIKMTKDFLVQHKKHTEMLRNVDLTKFTNTMQETQADFEYNQKLPDFANMMDALKTEFQNENQTIKDLKENFKP